MTPTDGHDERKRIFLLDGHSLAYRAYFALPATLATSTGQITNAVYGFTSMLIKLMGDEHPDYLAVAFDLGRPTVRLEKYAEYKAGRAETPTDFTSQLGLIDEVLDTLHVPMVRVVDHEADDAIGTLANRATESGLDAVIVTADRDFFQLVRPGIQVMFNRRGISDIVLYDEAGVEERFGVPPSKYLEYVALKGDPSDNIPGVPGVGEKTAAKLIQQYGSVEELLAHADELRGKLKDNVLAAADQLALNKELARIVTDLPLDIGPEDCVLGEWDPDEVRRLFTSLEFRSLLDRLQEVGVMKPKVEVTELDLREVSADELARDDRVGRAERRPPGRGPPRGARARPPRRGARRRRSHRWPRSARSPTRWRPRTRRSGRTTRRSWSAGRSPRAWRSPAWCSTRSSPDTCWTPPRPSTRCVR